MRFYNQPHRFYCGVDLHARTMYLCILDQAGAIVLHQEVPAEPGAFLEAMVTRAWRETGNSDRSDSRIHEMKNAAHGPEA